MVDGLSIQRKKISSAFVKLTMWMLKVIKKLKLGNTVQLSFGRDDINLLTY